MHVSYLYTPVLRFDSVVRHPENLDADVVVLDLEDSTHVTAKTRARQKLADLDLTPILDHGVSIGVRVNTMTSFDGIEDLLLLQALFARPFCGIEYLFLPKIRHHRDVCIYRSLFQTFVRPPKLISFIETVDSVDDADQIASVSDGLCFGQADLVSEMYGENEAFVQYARARLCVAAAKHFIEAIDTNSFAVKDLAQVECESIAARGQGFTGKAAIHPCQVPIINAVFTVSQETMDGYRAIEDLYLNSEVGFRVVDGNVIAPPFVAKARRMLALHAK